MQRLWIALTLLIPMKLLAWGYAGTDVCVQVATLQIFHDPESRLTPEEALAQTTAQPRYSSPHRIAEGYTKGTVWLLLQTQRAISGNGYQKCVLELANPQLDRVQIYHPENGVLTRVVEMGDQKNFMERLVPVRNYIFPYHAEQYHRFLFALQSTATMTVPLKVQWRDHFIADSSKDYLLLGLFYGLMLFFIFFGLHTFVSFRDKSYFFYSLFAIFMLLFFLDRDGIAYQYFWTDSPDWKMRSVRIFSALSMLAGTTYFFSILNLWRGPGKWLWGSYAVLSVLLIGALFKLHPSSTHHLAIYAGGATAVLWVALSGFALGMRRFFARYLLAASLISLGGLLIYALSVTGKLEPNLFTNNAMKFSTLLEFGFLALGLHARIKADNKRHERNKAIAEISAMFAHDVQRPMTLMGLFLDKIKDLPSEERSNYFDKKHEPIKVEIDYMIGALGDLKEMGKAPEKPTSTEIAPLLKNVCNGNYDLKFDYSGLVQGDALNLTRVFKNLKTNAKRATKGNGTFWCHTYERNDAVKIVFGNTGSTIPKHIIDRVFDMFFTYGNKANKGTGIGLAFVKKVINESGGTVWVESNGYRSNRKKKKPRLSEDYVEFHIKLPKGERYD